MNRFFGIPVWHSLIEVIRYNFFLTPVQTAAHKKSRTPIIAFLAKSTSDREITKHHDENVNLAPDSSIFRSKKSNVFELNRENKNCQDLTNE